MFSLERSATSVAIYPIPQKDWDSFKNQLSLSEQAWVKVQDFSAKAEQMCQLPAADGRLGKVLVGVDDAADVRWAIAGLPYKLPAGEYHLVSNWDIAQQTWAAIGWGLGCYRFDQYKSKAGKSPATLFIGCEHERIEAFVQAIHLVRDLINAPANHMMPEDLASVMQALAETHQAAFTQIIGDELLEQNYPAIHAVGRASKHAPQLLELRWGDTNKPCITLVGKGVCFDTGGLDIKPSQFMRLMKKDMGGAAHVLGLAKLIMQLQLPVALRVLVPAVDNAIGGDAFRPGDILNTRAGKYVEVDNTDAEGRLILCDALTDAAQANPALILDFATLTGAARVALGTEIPVFFTNNKALMQDLQTHADNVNELIWPLPLHQPYFAQLKSTFADFTNSGGSYGGAITAALFLNEFVPNSQPWAHFDVMAWNTRERAGRPVGGEAMGLMAVYSYLETVYREKTTI